MSETTIADAMKWVHANCSDEAVQRLRSRRVAKTLADEIERLREEVQRLSARLIEERHAAEIARENTVSAEPVAYRHLHEDGWEYYDAPTGDDCDGCQALYLAPPNADAKCHNDGGNCGAGGYCDDCHTPSADAKDDSEQAVNETNRVLADHYVLIENGWMRAIDEAMVCSHLGVAKSDDSYEDAKKKLNDLICWSIQAEKDLGADATDAARYVELQIGNDGLWAHFRVGKGYAYSQNLSADRMSKRFADEYIAAMQKGGV